MTVKIKYLTADKNQPFNKSYDESAHQQVTELTTSEILSYKTVHNRQTFSEPFLYVVLWLSPLICGWIYW